MGFVILPALVADIPEVYDAYFAAFKDNAVTRAFFPSATEEDMTNPNSEFRCIILPYYVTQESTGTDVRKESCTLRTSSTTGKKIQRNIL
jgi:hypothetical protein